MSWSGRSTLVVITVCAALGVACASASAAATPLPHVTGPIPVTAASYPFGAADHTLVPEDLSKVGYVEDEYFVSGKANVYIVDRRRVRGHGAHARTCPYTTRILVRRPAKASRFSGNVVVEMLNPSNQFDLNIGWAMAHRQMVRNGDAWVGITDKPIDVVALKKFDPARYGSLSFANPLRARRSEQLPEPRDVRRPDERALAEPPRTGSHGTSTARSARCCAAATATTRSPIAAAITTGVVGTAGTKSPPSTSTASATRRPAATSTTTSTPSTRSTWRATAGTRSTTATSWPWPAAGFVGIRADQPVRGHPEAPVDPRSAVLQRRRADHPRHVAVGLHLRPRPCAARTATRRRIASATTRWPAPPTPRPTS